MEINIFWRYFLLYETARFVQNNTLSYTVKKKTKTVLFWTTLYIFFFPDVQWQGKKVFLPLLCSTHIPSFYPDTTHAPHLPPWWRLDREIILCGWSDCIEATLATLPCLHDWTKVGKLLLPLSYKYPTQQAESRGKRKNRGNRKARRKRERLKQREGGKKKNKTNQR